MNLIEMHLKSIGLGLPALMASNQAARGQGPGALLIQPGHRTTVVGFARLEEIPEEETEIRRLAAGTPGGQTARMTVIIFDGRDRHAYQICTLVCWSHFKDGFVVEEEEHVTTPPDRPAHRPAREESHGNPDPFDLL